METDEFTRKRKEAVPGILGMNVLNLCRDILSNSDVPTDRILSEVFAKTTECDRKSIHGFARVSGTVPIRIPANAVVVLCCTGPDINGDIVVNPLTNGAHLHKNFQNGVYLY